MKKSNGFMRLLIVLPVFLFALLVIWIGANEWRGTKTKETAANIETTIEEVEETEETELTQAASSEETEGLTLVTEETAANLESETEEETGLIRLLFGGDVLLSNHVITAYDNAGGINGVLDEGYRSEIDTSDLFIVNQEFPFSERGQAASDKQFTFRLPPSKVSIMNELGIDLVSLANNHSLDYGTDALVDTCTTLDGAGIRYMGAGPNMDRARQLQTIEVRGKTIGFLAASRVYPDTSWVANSQKPGMVSGYDPTILLKEIENAQESCDYLVVYIHWGVERDEMPQEYQKALGRQLIDAGADMVIGSHPHVLQGVEYYKGKPICYSLGNFIFGSSIPKTALLRADIDLAQGAVMLSLVPGTSQAGFTRRLTDQAQLQEFYQYYQKLSFDVTVDENGIIYDNNQYTK